MQQQATKAKHICKQLQQIPKRRKATKLYKKLDKQQTNYQQATTPCKTQQQHKTNSKHTSNNLTTKTTSKT